MVVVANGGCVAADGGCRLSDTQAGRPWKSVRRRRSSCKRCSCSNTHEYNNVPQVDFYLLLRLMSHDDITSQVGHGFARHSAVRQVTAPSTPPFCRTCLFHFLRAILPRKFFRCLDLDGDDHGRPVKWHCPATIGRLGLWEQEQGEPRGGRGCGCPQVARRKTFAQ